MRPGCPAVPTKLRNGKQEITCKKHDFSQHLRMLSSIFIEQLNSYEGLGGNENPGACTFWVGTYPWRDHNLGETSPFPSSYIMGTDSDIRRRKKDDIDGTFI